MCEQLHPTFNKDCKVYEGMCNCHECWNFIMKNLQWLWPDANHGCWWIIILLTSHIARLMGPTWGPPGSCRPQIGPMLSPWTLLSWYVLNIKLSYEFASTYQHFFKQMCSGPALVDKKYGHTGSSGCIMRGQTLPCGRWGWRKLSNNRGTLIKRGCLTSCRRHFQNNFRQDIVLFWFT